MKCITWNVRGITKKEKRGRIKKILKDNRVDMVLFQETKQKSITSDLIRSIWWNDKWEFMEVDALESAGGLLYIWNPNVFNLLQAVGNRNFIILSGMLDCSFHCVIANVYGSNCTSERKLLWERLTNLRTFFSGPWCLGGDLNEVRYSAERHGCSSRDSNMRRLNKFIEDMELVDLPMLGRKFTWSNGQNGEKWSRIEVIELINLSIGLK